jgi:hypothetical protein
MPVTDLHPSGSILAAGNTLKCVNLPANSRTPLTYTITVSSAPTANATTLAVTILPAPTVGAPLLLEDGAVLDFGGKKVTLDNATVGVTLQTITSGTASLKTKPILTADIPTVNATNVSLGLLELLGVQNMDYNKNSNLISIRSQKSGLYNEQRPTMVSAEFQVSGWIHQRDQAFRQVIQPSANTGKEIYCVIDLTDGRTISGVFGVANLTTPIQLDQVMQMNFNLFAQGFPTEVYN